MTDLPRRDFIRSAAGTTAAVGAMAVPKVYGQATNDTLQVALIGCGGRGTGAASNALRVDNGPTKLVAMADVFENRLEISLSALNNEFRETPDKVDVPKDRRHVGFDAYEKALDALNPGDIAVFATPLAFRWVHFQKAIEKGLHVFMEKPLIADGPSAKRMLELSKKADEKNLKCAVGLMIRHCRGRQQLHQRIQDGEIGDIIAMRAYRMQGVIGSCFSTKKPEHKSEVEWQIERFHSFLWASGGSFSDFYIHQIDETSWMKNAFPIKAHAVGGRHYRHNEDGELYVDQNFDTYSVEYTYPDGTKLFFDGRNMLGCQNEMSSVVHGTKGSAFVSKFGHSPRGVSSYKDQEQNRRQRIWEYDTPKLSPYDLEWEDFVDAIVNDKPYNEVPRGVEASLVTSMGRMAAHTGQEITIEQMRECPQMFAPDADKMTMDGPAPVMPDADGLYPIPKPGINKKFEYVIEA
ncbi:Gfo/Idh/MocA family protein [Crateriforma spongiae]|uniref:Gfo/Idh/MocA family protein n=1 Tax=Crateriforma spongiae TaxID=2724528 RepID=UPI0039AF66AD